MGRIIYAVILEKEYFDVHSSLEFMKLSGYTIRKQQETEKSYQFIVMPNNFTKNKIPKILQDRNNRGVKYLGYLEKSDLEGLK